MNSSFKPPSTTLSILVTFTGVLTAIAIIIGLENISSYFSTNSLKTKQSGLNPQEQVKLINKLDADSIKSPGSTIKSAELVSRETAEILANNMTNLNPQEIAMAKSAWVYFQNNWHDSTGMVNSAEGFTAVTMWDQAAAIAALVSAKEFGMVSNKEFELKMMTMCNTLAKLPLYQGELPNKVYNSQTLIPVNYGKLTQKEEIGWSAIDLGRLAIWLKIVGNKYPQFKNQTEAVWKHWQIKRLTKDGQMYGTSINTGKEEYHQEGRLGYESYAAYGLKLWGLDVKKALDISSKVGYVNLYGESIPYDKRDYQISGANNYVLSEPYILDGIETGFQSLPKVYAHQILAAQEARYKATQKLTALTEDNLDREPYFVYNTLFVNGQAWATITDGGKNHNDLRFLSAKAAVGWHILYNNSYTQKLFDFTITKMKSPQGWYGGFYESLLQPNKSLTANNNGIILETLLYKKVGKPLTIWAGVK